MGSNPVPASLINKIMSKIDRMSVYIDLVVHNYVLTRVDDNKQMPCGVVKFVEWNEDGTFKAVHDKPAVGRSIIADPDTFGSYQWMTSTITEVVSDTQFKTQNSTYTLHSLT